MGLLDLIPFVGTLLDRILPDPSAAAAAKLEMLKLQMNNDEAMNKMANDVVQSQLNINAVEAASPSLLVSGGRPFIIWVCGFAFAWQFLLMPITVFVLTAVGHPVANLPNLDMGEMMPVLGGLLGLGGLRTLEKVKGVART